MFLSRFNLPNLKALKTIVAIFVLIVCSGENTYAHSLHFNAGAAFLTIIPTAFAELEYGKPVNTLRIHYSSSMGNPLSSKRYQSVLLQYEFAKSEIIMNPLSYYLSAGKSKTTGGGEREYDYLVLGFGAKEIFGNKKIIGNFTIKPFLNFFLNIYSEIPVAGQTSHDTAALPGIGLGFQLF